MADQLPRREAVVLRGHEGPVLAVRFNSDGNYCISCGRDRVLCLWNPQKGLRIKSYNAHAREVRDVAVVADNSKFCSCGADRQLFYWDVPTGRVIRKFRGHDSEVNTVKFSENSTVIVSGGYDRSVRAFDCRSHSIEPIQVIEAFSDSVTSLCMTRTEIIAGSVDGSIRTFDIRAGRVYRDDLGHPINSVTLSHDGKCTLAGCLDSTLRLIDRETGDLLQEYKGHINKSYKTDSCLTNTDAHVVGSSEDGRIYYWDLVDSSVVSSFKAHASAVTSIAYHKTEPMLVTSSIDGTVRVWTP
ncbi:WD repeat domain-containing protein 83 isoform X4 [Selaginella moellendorffii]|uniref:WD repeat domain-containing protein 83 isoform X4 n=1 Tax=Selaginella moellendorffii TaxID=88036 RepID=UPI000D1CAE20|nr:WD repeat domain-containing protein 83 isoform X4 [Selaginella moellendorffii]|eukprot:XP_024517444.1 WD repeat domain-containing protein 83 isoform X4 [Selaginella moellendorffii]